MSWAEGINREYDELIDRASRVIGDAVYQGYSYATGRSPVCTGFLRASWLTSVDSCVMSSKRKNIQCRPGMHTDYFSGTFSVNRSRSRGATNSFSLYKNTSLCITNSATYSAQVAGHLLGGIANEIQRNVKW